MDTNHGVLGVVTPPSSNGFNVVKETNKTPSGGKTPIEEVLYWFSVTLSFGVLEFTSTGKRISGLKALFL